MLRRRSKILALTTPAVVAAALLVAGCGDSDETTAEAGCTDVSAPAAKDVEMTAPTEKTPSASNVVFDTSCGSFTVALDAETNPETAASFQFLAAEGVYDDTPIHRVAPGFVIQGGDPTGVGDGGPGYSLTEKVPTESVYSTGVVAMAKSLDEAPGTSGSQFFVVTAPGDAGLPPDYAIVGRVSEGEETLDAIEAVGTDEPTGDGPPSQDIVIETATVEE